MSTWANMKFVVGSKTPILLLRLDSIFISFVIASIIVSSLGGQPDKYTSTGINLSRFGIEHPSGNYTCSHQGCTHGPGWVGLRDFFLTQPKSLGWLDG